MHGAMPAADAWSRMIWLLPCSRQVFTHVFRRVTDCPVYIARHPDTDGILARAHQRGV